MNNTLIPNQWQRRAVPVALASALVLLATVSAWVMLTGREQLRESTRESVQRDLEAEVEEFENWLRDRVGLWLSSVADDPNRAGAIQSQRLKHPWLDSIYVWEVKQTAAGPGAPPRPRMQPLLFPQTPPRELGESRHGCIVRGLASAGGLEDVALQAHGLVSACRGQAPLAQLSAGREALVLIEREVKAEEDPERLRRLAEISLEVLDHVGDQLQERMFGVDWVDPPFASNRNTLQEAIQEGVAPATIVRLRARRCELLTELGRGDQAVSSWQSLAVDIAGLDAPSGAEVRNFGDAAISGLRRMGRSLEADTARNRLFLLDQRLVAWEEVRTRLLELNPGPASTEISFSYDQYGEGGYLLAYGFTEPEQRQRTGRTVGVALVLDRPTLLRALLQRLDRKSGELVVLDEQDHVVAGPPVRPDDLALEVNFSLLPEVQLGARQALLDRRLRVVERQWYWQAGALLFVVLLGGLAIWLEIQAQRRLEDLVVRQRQFTTRVTHELKTPLAGIKVMAENLEAGAWKDERHMRLMAQRIVDEADRLNQRVNEILSVARERALPRPEPFDPEEAVLAAVEQWGPRLEQAGVGFEADLHPTAEVNGDQDAIRDVIGCLLDNALKYHREDRDDPFVWLVLKEEGRFVTIEVTDNGLGVPQNLRKKIFDRFVRVEGPNRGKAGGHGLGLSQVAEVLRAHGGQYQCTEGVDGGARFTLKLPALS